MPRGYARLPVSQLQASLMRQRPGRRRFVRQLLLALLLAMLPALYLGPQTRAVLNTLAPAEVAANAVSSDQIVTAGQLFVPYLRRDSRPNNLWPLPPLPSGGGASSTSYWWSYRWTDGARTGCLANDAGSRGVAFSANYFQDGAFGNPDLLSINFFKEHRCTYWRPGHDELFRWYSLGFQPSLTRIEDRFTPGLAAERFLSFRGDSRWLPDRSASTRFYSSAADATPAVELNGRYSLNYNGGLKYTYEPNPSSDVRQFPIYATLPDRAINADVVLSRNSSLRQPRRNGTWLIEDAPLYGRYPATSQGWWTERNDPAAYSGINRARWGMYMRPTTFRFQGKQVFYVGYSETGDDAGWAEDDPRASGACEEWWLAEDIGPIIIATYGNATMATCKTYLAAFVGDVNDPLGFLRAPQTVDRLLGWLQLEQWCVAPECKVDY